jgi:putative flippase GtrA
MENRTRVALIPAFEPTESLVRLTEDLHDAGFCIVLVDDGSGPKYEEIFITAWRCAIVISYADNRGKGSALKTGLEFICRQFPPDAVIVTLDADGQHSVADAVRVCDRAARTKGALVLGCRSFEGDVPARSRFGNTVTRFVYRLTTGTRVSDTQTGLRAFGADLIPFLLRIPGARYEYEMNVLLACPGGSVPIVEVGIETIYLDNNAGSHFDSVKDSFRVYREILKFAASSFTGFLVDYGLYSLLVVLTGGLGTAVSVPLSNITARVVSAGVNYTLNRKLVFRSSANVVRTGAQYAALAAGILAGNTLLLSWLVGGLGVNRFAAKLVTEITFFSLSWLAQKYIIFRKAGVPRFGGARVRESGNLHEIQ